MQPAKKKKEIKEKWKVKEQLVLLLIRCFTYNNGNLSPGPSYNAFGAAYFFLKLCCFFLLAMSLTSVFYGTC